MMYTITAQYLGRRIYEITVKTERKTVKKQFVEPLHISQNSAARITEIVESLNVEDDIDVLEGEILAQLIEAAKRAGRTAFYRLNA